MATHVHIEDLAPYNGDHPIDLSYFTNRDWHTIKTIAGVRPTELEEALVSADTDVLVSIAVIALRRAGLMVDLDRLWDAPVGKIQFVVDEPEEADAGPPSQPPTELGGTEIATVKPNSSGISSSGDGDLQESSPSPTGTPLSATPATSPLERSAT